MSSDKKNEERIEFSGGEIIAGLFGGFALLFVGGLFLWAMWRAMEPVFMTWCSMAWAIGR